MRIHKPRNPARRLSDLSANPPARRPAGGVVRPARSENAVAPVRPVTPMAKPVPRPGARPLHPEPVARPKPAPRRRVPPKG